MKIRFKNMVDFKVLFHKFIKPGSDRFYLDGWNNYICFGFMSLSWITPPLSEDLNE